MFSLTLLPQTLMVGGINGSVQLSVFGWNIHSWIIMTSNISKEWIAKCQVNLPEAAWDNKWTTQMSFCMLLSTHPQHRSWRSRNRGCGRFTHRSIEWGCSILGGWDEFLGPQKKQATWQSRNEKNSTSFLCGSGLQSYLVINSNWQLAIEICGCAVTSAHHCRALSHPEISIWFWVLNSVGRHQFLWRLWIIQFNMDVHLLEAKFIKHIWSVGPSNFDPRPAQCHSRIIPQFIFCQVVHCNRHNYTYLPVIKPGNGSFNGTIIDKREFSIAMFNYRRVLK